MACRGRGACMCSVCGGRLRCYGRKEAFRRCGRALRTFRIFRHEGRFAVQGWLLTPFCLGSPATRVCWRVIDWQEKMVIGSRELVIVREEEEVSEVAIRCDEVEVGLGDIMSFVDTEL